jgi:hypothetical protein
MHKNLNTDFNYLSILSIRAPLYTTNTELPIYIYIYIYIFNQVAYLAKDGNVTSAVPINTTTFFSISQ